MKKLLLLLTVLLMASSAMAERVVVFNPSEDKDATTGTNVTNGSYTLEKNGLSITVSEGAITDDEYRMFESTAISVDVDVDWETLYEGEYGIFYGRLKSIEFICTDAYDYGPENLECQSNLPGGEYSTSGNVGYFDTEGYSTRDTYYFTTTSEVRCKYIVITVYADPIEPNEKTATPEITLQQPTDNEYLNFIVEAVGKGDVDLYLAGEWVQNPFRIPRDEEDRTYEFTATAQEPGKLVSDVATFEITVPAFCPKFVITEGEDEYTIEAVMTDETIDAYGMYEYLYLYGDYGVEEEGFDVLPNPCVIPRLDEDVTYHFASDAWMGGTVTFQVYTEVTVPAKKVFHEAPVITWIADNGSLTVTATGDGFIMLEIGNEGITRTGEDEATYNIGYDPEVGIILEVKACIWENGAPVSDYTYEYIRVEPIGDLPEVPQEGYWLARVADDGSVMYDELMAAYNGDYIQVFDIEYPKYQDYCGFYFVIDGQTYGAVEDMTPADLGLAENNPLVPGENRFFVSVGYCYTIGIHVEYDMETMEMNLCAYVAVGGPVDVEEVATAKTVADVRYFNVAGQEMQEANGMTIAITTYTDGSTSVAKIIK